MKTIKSLAYPLLVIAVWVFFAVAALSGLKGLDASLHSISGAARPAANPAESTAQDRTPRVAHVATSPGPTHTGQDPPRASVRKREAKGDEMRKYATTIAGTAFTVAVVAIVAARGPDPHELPPGATLAAAASTGAEAAHPSTPAAMPAPQQLAAIAPPDAQPAASNSALLATERDVTWVEEPRPASAIAEVVGHAQQENDELRQIERDVAEGLQEAADDAWRREAVAAQAAARRAATLEALATLRRSDALLGTGDSDGVDDELARAEAALSGRTLLDIEAAREALARDDLYPARQYLKAALAERRLPR